jgi:hypothetical protein
MFFRRGMQDRFDVCDWAGGMGHLCYDNGGTPPSASQIVIA